MKALNKVASFSVSSLKGHKFQYQFELMNGEGKFEISPAFSDGRRLRSEHKILEFTGKSKLMLVLASLLLENPRIGNLKVRKSEENNKSWKQIAHA